MDADDVARGKLARLGKVGSALGGAVGVALLPKCPLCVAALLGAAGLSAGGAHFLAPLVRPALLGLAALLFLWAAWSSWRTVGRRACARWQACPSRTSSFAPTGEAGSRPHLLLRGPDPEARQSAICAR